VVELVGYATRLLASALRLRRGISDARGGDDCDERMGETALGVLAGCAAFMALAALLGIVFPGERGWTWGD
jgi:hypothetical protein